MSLRTWVGKSLLGVALLAASTATAGAQYKVLWFDSTPEYGSQAPDPLRRAMADYLTGLNGGTLFNATYLSSESPGSLAAALTGTSYDVIVFDATSQSQKFSAADLAAVQTFYASGNNNLLFDGSLYIRSINYNSTTVFPGPNGALGGLTANEVFQLASRGGGIMVGTDHNCCQTDANQIVQALVPNASFSGITYPSVDGVFNGTQMLTGAVNVAPLGIFTHWDSVPTQGIAPTGNFSDYAGTALQLYSQVDVADDPGGGTRYSYISTSFKPGSGTVIITDPDPPTTVPEPGTYALVAVGLGALGWTARRRAA